MPSAEPLKARGCSARRDGGQEAPQARDPSVPAAVYRIALVLVAWILLVEAVAYGRGTYQPVVVGVCVVFTVIAFGLPSLMAGLRRPDAPGAGPPGLRAWLRQRVQTASGPLTGRGALIQILLIPFSVALGFTAISLVELFVR